MNCMGCGRSDRVSKALGYCADCIRAGGEAIAARTRAAHAESRSAFPLPTEIPRSDDGRTCHRCENTCRIPDGGRGYCGVRRVENRKLVGGSRHEGRLSSYRDPLPTNCVADWVCPAGTSAGYPRFTGTEGPEYGHSNLAVFYLGCTFDCLFCQNWQCREVDSIEGMTAGELAGEVTDEVSCICYFGGDPTPQLRHAVAAAKQARKARKNGILRICWETNGAMNRRWLRRMIDISLESGGIIKFDLKAWDDRLHYALTGVSNRATLDNVDLIAKYLGGRPDPPLFVASTLLVPGYVDAEDVGAIARFLAERSPEIPYSLLAFAPQFAMSDLPRTSRDQGERCRDAALAAGLKRVRIGNEHLLR